MMQGSAAIPIGSINLNLTLLNQVPNDCRMVGHRGEVEGMVSLVGDLIQVEL